MKTLRILASRNPDFDLRDLLAHCRAYETRRWVVWNVEWTLTPDADDPVEYQKFYPDCYHAIANAPDNQAEITFKKLIECASVVCQTEWGFFMAVRPDIQKVPKLTTLNSCVRLSDLIIEAFDGHLWEVTGSDESLLFTLASKFQYVEWHDRMMEGGSPIPYD